MFDRRYKIPVQVIIHLPGAMTLKGVETMGQEDQEKNLKVWGIRLCH